MNPLHKLTLGLASVLLIVLIGISGLMALEGLDFVQAAYLTVVTLTTTGFGDIVVHSRGGMIFVTFLLVVGVTVIAYTSGIFVSIILEGQLQSFLGRRNMSNEIAKLKNHIIVCGAGRVGRHVVESLHRAGESFVVIEGDTDVVESLRSKGTLVIEGDATDDAILEKAGIKQARGLISALSTDSDNVFVTLTSKELNPQISVVARVERPESEQKLRRAGADKVISPAVIGGYRMASAMLKPASVKFVESLMQFRQLDIEIEEILLSPASSLVGLQLQQTTIRAEGVTVMAIVRENDVIINPRADETLQANDLLIVLGRRSDLPRLEEMAGSRRGPQSKTS